MSIKKNVLNSSKLVPLLLFLVLCLGCGLQNDKFTDQWPQYRGIYSDGISNSTATITSWIEGGTPHQVWKQSIGDAFSGLTIAGSRLITGFSEDSTEFLGAFDRQNGNEIWRYNMNKLFVEEFGDGPRATPAIDESNAYMFDSWGVMHCVNLQTGEMIWKNPIAEQFKLPSAQNRGFTASPVILDGKVILFASGMDTTAFMGLDKITGKILWKNSNSVPTFSSPTLTEIHGEKQVIFASTRVIQVDGRRRGVYELTSLNAKGEILWTGPGLPGVITMPVLISPNKIFVSSQMRAGSKALEIMKENGVYSVKEAWTSTTMKNHFNSAVHMDGYMYGFSNATLECQNAETGKRLWRKRGLGKGSLIVADGKLLVLSDKGSLHVVEATPEKYTELAAAQVIEGKSWTTPTFADGKLYVRNLEEMACYDLTK
ncbi:PQQ-binding-like beta-propeller repeat protein [bacterium]|nr:PQQ-binding-like beta-propeller repeat protein [bacterium]